MLPVAKEAVNAVMLWAALVLVLAVHFAAAKALSKNGSHYAKRPTSTVWADGLAKAVTEKIEIDFIGNGDKL